MTELRKAISELKHELVKARTKKYLWKKPDGKGGFIYIYKDTDKKEKKELNHLNGIKIYNKNIFNLNNFKKFVNELENKINKEFKDTYPSIGLRAIGKKEEGLKELKPSEYLPDGNHSGEYLSGTSTISAINDFKNATFKECLNGITNAYENVHTYDNNSKYIAIVAGFPSEIEGNDPGEIVLDSAITIGYILREIPSKIINNLKDEYNFYIEKKQKEKEKNNPLFIKKITPKGYIGEGYIYATSKYGGSKWFKPDTTDKQIEEWVNTTKNKK